MGILNKHAAAFACLLIAPLLAQAEEHQFSVEATYSNAALASLNFDYRSNSPKAGIPGFIADNTRQSGSTCYARIPGSDNLTAYLDSIKNKPIHQEIEETRGRMRDSVARSKLEVWQEALCINERQAIPYRETGNGNGGKWSSVPIILNGERQGAWTDVFTIVRPNHIYSITVHPVVGKP